MRLSSRRGGSRCGSIRGKETDRELKEIEKIKACLKTLFAPASPSPLLES